MYFFPFDKVFVCGIIACFGFNKNVYNFQFSYNIPDVIFFSDAIFQQYNETEIHICFSLKERYWFSEHFLPPSFDESLFMHAA